MAALRGVLLVCCLLACYARNGVSGGSIGLSPLQYEGLSSDFVANAAEMAYEEEEADSEETDSGESDSGAPDSVESDSIVPSLADWDPDMYGASMRERFKEVRLELYSKQNPDEPELIQMYDFEVPKLVNFNANRPTKVAIHGWMTNGVGVWGLRSAFLDTMDVNFILVNWTQVDTLIYPAARYKVDPLGQWVALMLDFLRITEGLKMSDVHIIGHSLGAHISGMAGKKVRWGRVGRISGLDPAGPLFDEHPDGRLSDDDADFVDVIHTCANVLGFREPIGHVDFYPNRGTCVQPGCTVLDLTTGTCSHNRAYDFYQESIYGESKFKAWPCEGAGTDANMTQPAVLMGYPAEPVPAGSPTVYCLRTNKNRPFALPEEEQRQGRFQALFPWSLLSDKLPRDVRRQLPQKEHTAMDAVVWTRFMTRGMWL